jgi:hypothetical protein
MYEEVEEEDKEMEKKKKYCHFGPWPYHQAPTTCPTNAYSTFFCLETYYQEPLVEYVSCISDHSGVSPSSAPSIIMKSFMVIWCLVLT